MRESTGSAEADQDEVAGVQAGGPGAVDWDELRATLRRAHARYDSGLARVGVICPWCDKLILGKADIHEVLVARSAVPRALQHLIFKKENCVLVCHDEHLQHHHSRELTRRCLLAMVHRVQARRIGLWYRELWAEHGLHVPKGLLLRPLEVPMPDVIRCIGAAAQVHGQALPDEQRWLINNKGAWVDYRAWVATRWKGHRPRWSIGTLPTEHAGIEINQLRFLIEEGYWLKYIAGIAGFTPEELLDAGEDKPVE